jgi:hypothetical protein
VSAEKEPEKSRLWEDPSVNFGVKGVPYGKQRTYRIKSEEEHLSPGRALVIFFTRDLYMNAILT